MTQSKIVFITGATSAIGSAVASAFCSHGAKVFLTGRSERKIANAARKLPRAKLAGTALGDLESLPDVERLVDEIPQHLPHIDVLVHAAGLYSWTELGDPATEEFEKLFAVNVRAPYMLTQGLLPLLERGKGQVFFLNSSVVNTPDRKSVV